MSELHGGMAACGAADVWEHFTKNPCIFVSEGKKRENS